MDHTTYASPFSWRYGSAELRALFSEEERRKLWRAVWVALAQAQARAGLITDAEVADLRAHAHEIDIEAALAIEREIHHDLMAEIRVFASQATGRRRETPSWRDLDGHRGYGRDLPAAVGAWPRSARILHELAARLCGQDATVRRRGLHGVHPFAAGRADDAGISAWPCTPKICLIDDTNLRFVFDQLTTKGLRGAVGTAASYEQLLDHQARSRIVRRARSRAFGLRARDISTQTYPRKLDYLLLSGLAGLGASLSKFAADVRILSSPEFGELAEPFGRSQVGSSAMPFKRNPILCERIDSLARLLVSYSDVAWQNASTNYLERTLDDSANRRTILPEAILCADEIVTLARKVIDGLRVDERRIAHNLRIYGPFAGTEAVMMEAARAGGDRQVLHERIREAAMEAWAALAQGQDNPLAQMLAGDATLTALLDPAEIRRLLDPGKHVGTAPQRARALADRIDA